MNQEEKEENLAKRLVNEEIQNELDLSGENYLKNLKVDEEIEIFSSKLISIKITDKLLKQGLKSFRLIWKVFYEKKSILICSRIFSILKKYEFSSWKLFVYIK